VIPSFRSIRLPTGGLSPLFTVDRVDRVAGVTKKTRATCTSTLAAALRLARYTVESVATRSPPSNARRMTLSSSSAALPATRICSWKGTLRPPLVSP
jgi:hypothetical protein